MPIRLKSKTASLRAKCRLPTNIAILRQFDWNGRLDVVQSFHCADSSQTRLNRHSDTPARVSRRSACGGLGGGSSHSNRGGDRSARKKTPLAAKGGQCYCRESVDTHLIEYLQRILTARVYDVAIESALERAPKLSRRFDCHVWLKREDTQPAFSFKLRGAYNKMVRLAAPQLQKGVICASAGNHAQGVALSARRLGCRAVVVMPVTTPTLKSDNVRALGAEVILHGDSYSDAYQHAVELERDLGLTFIHPFDDPDVIAGQGTIGMEILRQHQDPHGGWAQQPGSG